ncbi:MAG TPA: hypothetical protein VF519_10370 [Mycobacteriales bacterium]
MKRTLTLKSESLTELSSGELASVAGAQQAIPTLPMDVCFDTLQATRCFCP